MNFILNFLNGFFKNTAVQMFILSAVILILIALNVKQCQRIDEIHNESVQNTLALKGFTIQVKDNLNILNNQTASFVGDLKTIKEMNAELFNRIKSLNGDVLTISEIVGNITIPPSEVVNIDVAKLFNSKGAEYIIKWDKVDSIGSFNYSIAGETRLLYDSIKKDIVDPKIFLTNQNYEFKIETYFLKDDKDRIMAGVRPYKQTPGFDLNVIKSAYLDETDFIKTKKDDYFYWGIGPYLSWDPWRQWQYGIGTNVSLKILSF